MKSFTLQHEPYFKACGEEAGKSTQEGHCADNGVNLPSALHLNEKEFYGFSEFWYTMEDILGLGGVYQETEFKDAAQKFCSTKWEVTYDKFTEGKYPKADKERLETQCFKSAWIAVALHQGFNFPNDYHGLTSSPNTVGGRVAHWTVGALLYRTRYFPLSFHLQESGKNTGIKIKCPIHHKTILDHFPFVNKMFASFSSILFSAKDNMLSTFTISLFCQNKLFRQKEDSSETSKVHLSQEKETMFTIPSSHTSLGHGGKKSESKSPWYKSPTVGIWISIFALHCIPLFGICAYSSTAVLRATEEVR